MRENQKHRTRQALVDAATRLARAGRPLAIVDVAEAALVSPATAYRYFPNPQSLWLELAATAPDLPTIAEILDGASQDPEERIDRVVTAVAGFQLRDEATWRALLRATLERWFAQRDQPTDEHAPIRGDRRLRMTEQALAPLQPVLPAGQYRRLVSAVMLVYGMEALVTTRDASDLAPDEATETMRWAARALVRAALAEIR